MSDKQGNNEQLESAKRFVGDLVADMKSRNLLLPAIALFVAIVAAMVVLPKKSSDVAVTPPAAPVVQKPAVEPEKAIQIALITPTAMGEAEPLTSSSNPFLGTSSYSCTTVSSGEPKVLSCEVSDLKVRVVCPPKATDPPCGKKQGAGEAGASGEAGGAGGSTGGTGGETITTKGNGKDPVIVYVYRVTVQLDGKTYKNLDQGDPVPSKDNVIATFVNVNGSAKRAGFKVPEGSIVTGVTLDETGLAFPLNPGQTAKITDPTGDTHKLKLISISKARA